MAAKRLVRSEAQMFMALHLVLLAALPASATISTQERHALLALYKSTNGRAWTRNTGWLGSVGTECEWYGVTCDEGHDHIVSLKLGSHDGNNLSGVLPKQIGLLTRLAGLDLRSNHLRGKIPTQIWGLRSLGDLDLADNQLVGTIPTAIANVSGLWNLDLSYNRLEGTIPAQIGNLTNLRSLRLAGNRLNGSIPKEIGSLSHLQDLILSGNMLTGGIPPEIGSFSDIRLLELQENQLSGGIPTSVASLSRLEYLHLRSNRLSGEIPPEIGALSNLEGLDLTANELSGSIPASIGNLSRLHYLSLCGNHLNGAIPPEIGRLSNLGTLFLASNQLRGSIPVEIQRLTKPVLLLSLEWNALRVSDARVHAYLAGLEKARWLRGDWQETQTVPPSDLRAEAPTDLSVTLRWTPVSTRSGPGYYRILRSTVSGGPYETIGRTASKTESQFAVGGLSPGTTYYFVVEAVTDPHTDNKNQVVSERAPEVSATTTTSSDRP